jgi:toxin CptA
MWSNRFATALVLRPEPSRRLAYLLCALHGIATVGLLAVSLPVGLAGLPVMMVSLYAHLRGAGWLGGRMRIRELRVEPDGSWRVMDAAGTWTKVRVSPESLCLPGLCVLRLRADDRRHVLALAGDSAGPATLRRLRGRLLALDADSLEARRGIGARLRGLGSPRGRDTGEIVAIPSDQERLEALLIDDPDHVDSDEELDAIAPIDTETALRIDRAQ